MIPSSAKAGDSALEALVDAAAGILSADSLQGTLGRIAHERFVDPEVGRLYIGHASDAFEASGVRVLNAADLTEIANYPGTAFGNKVYGISVDSAKGRVRMIFLRTRSATAMV